MAQMDSNGNGGRVATPEASEGLGGALIGATATLPLRPMKMT